MSRLSYSMVAQSMLVMAFATLFSADLPTLKIRLVEIVIACFGLFYSWVQYVMTRSLVAKLQMLKENYLIPLDPVFKEYMDTNPTVPPTLQSTWLAMILGGVWFILLLSAIWAT
ncbi:MAG: hypothetical protein K8H87_12650 [Pseudorhodoplanes sp.]|nr:hypothetical protein [Pseudorhodoplanes sp.]